MPNLIGVLALLLAGCGGNAADDEAALGQGMGVPDTSASRACAYPAADWDRRDPAAMGFDAAKLEEAFDWANQHTGLTVAVYRHGCLVDESKLDALTADQPLDGWSMTKSVTSMVVGRAVTMGLFNIDEPIGRLVPEADPAHARLTPRQLLTMRSGLHSNYTRDFALPLPDRVCDALALPFDHEPGTYWQYAQTTLDLLVHALERSTRRDFQEFAQAELFGPIGIAPDAWTWDRDPHGHTNAWAHLKMRNQDWARLGLLMMSGGRWEGRQLLSEDYIRQALTRLPQNPAYGFLFWLNGGSWWEVPDVEGRDSGFGSVLPAGPSDMFMFVGLGEQRVYMIPSRDLMIVRVGERGSHDPDTRVAVWSGRGGEVDHELLRRVLLAVTDVPYHDPGPYESAGAHAPDPGAGLLEDALDLQDNAQAMSTPACH